MGFTAGQISELRRVPIADVLASFGCDMRRTPRGKYFSPFRAERTPSFFVDDIRNVYVDYGDELHSHSVIDLVQRLAGCSFTQALERLSRMSPSVAPPPAPPRARRQAIEVVEVCDGVPSPALRRYAESRFIPVEILELYCSQVEYVIRGRRHCAIGFRNRAGWSLRNDVVKLSTGQDLSFLRRDGMYDGACTRTHDVVRVFEGFFDFPSLLLPPRRHLPAVKADFLTLECNL